MKPRSAAARILLMSLACGLALSLAAAWGDASLSALRRKPGRLREDSDVLVSMVRDRAAARFGDIPPPRPDPADPHYECRAYGFPLGSLGAVYRISSSRPAYPSDTSQLVFGVGLGGTLTVGPRLTHEAALPLLPMTPEIVVDTLALGAPVGLRLWWRVRRRARRERLNLCPGCGYAQTGLASGAACPECGRTS